MVEAAVFLNEFKNLVPRFWNYVDGSNLIGCWNWVVKHYKK